MRKLPHRGPLPYRAELQIAMQNICTVHTLSNLGKFLYDLNSKQMVQPSLVLTITITNVLCGIQTSELQTIPGSFQPYPFLNRTARHCNENSRRIFPEMKLRGLVSSSYIHVSHSDLYIPMIGPPILLFVGRSWENINPCPN